MSNSKIKKTFQPLHTLLTKALNDKQINPKVFKEAEVLMSAKTSGGGNRKSTTYIKNSDGRVLAIKCYYFKRWMPLVGSKAVEFGAKKSTAHGYNTMCKVGNSLWTKQYAEYKKSTNGLLGKVADGTIKPQDLPKIQKDLEAKRNAIAPTDLGFKTLDEVQKYLIKNGEKFIPLKEDDESKPSPKAKDESKPSPKAKDESKPSPKLSPTKK